MDTEQTIPLGAYYGTAIPRAWHTGIDWAFGQGLALTLLLGIGAVVCASGYAVFRAIRRSHSWADAMSKAGEAVKDFLVAGAGATAFVLIGLFVWSFINDAPRQLAEAHRQSDNWRKAWENQAIADRREIKELETAKNTEIDQLTRQLKDAASAYSISFDNIQVVLDVTNPRNALELRLILKNTTSLPLRWTCIKYEEGLLNSKVISTASGDSIMSAGASVTYFANAGLSLSEYRRLEHETNGTLEYEIEYGPAGETTYTHKEIWLMRIFLFKNTTNNVSVNWVIDKNIDTSL